MWIILSVRIHESHNLALGCAKSIQHCARVAFAGCGSQELDRKCIRHSPEKFGRSGGRPVLTNDKTNLRDCVALYRGMKVAKRRLNRISLVMDRNYDVYVQNSAPNVPSIFW